MLVLRTIQYPIMGTELDLEVYYQPQDLCYLLVGRIEPITGERIDSVYFGNIEEGDSCSPLILELDDEIITLTNGDCFDFISFFEH